MDAESTVARSAPNILYKRDYVMTYKTKKTEHGKSNVVPCNLKEEQAVYKSTNVINIFAFTLGRRRIHV